MSNLTDEEQKKITRMKIINDALEDGWTIKKSDIGPKTYEFTKNKLLDDDYKGLVIFSKSNTLGTSFSICNDIQKHLENIKKHSLLDEKKPDTKRSVSTPIIKNKEA